jgi:hypothetical protein
MPRQRWAWTHRHAVPMFVASLISVVVSGLGLLAVVNADWDGGADPEDPGCLVGQWRMVSHTETLDAGGTPVQLTLVGEGAAYEFREDGTGSADYGEGTQFRGEAVGQTIPATIDGTLRFRYTAADGIFQVVEMLGTGATFTMDILGSPIEVPYQLSVTSPESYRCEGDTVNFSAEDRGYAAEYQRI